LHDVTKIYRERPPDHAQSAGRFSEVDRAFSERLIAQAAAEHARRLASNGPLVALNNVNLNIPDGQTMAILGPSGCGKSTLLRVVAGLEPEYSGLVLYDGQDMRDTPPYKRHVGMVFQNYALYPHFEGHGNLSFFFKMRRATDKETEERIRITSETMGIGFNELLKRKPGALSGGEQQRLALARAIVRNPDLFLFDEPLSNLDAKLRAQTRIEIKRLLHRFQITSIYVTHDQEEATTLGDQLAIMRAGHIEQVGAHQILRERPANTFVAGFLGSPPMNLLPGGIIGNNCIRLDEITMPIPNSIKERGIHTGQEVTLGIRPEAAHLLFGSQPSAPGFCLRGLVQVVEPDFAHRTQLVYARTGRLAYAATGQLDTSVRIGDTVDVFFPLDHLYVFDAKTEHWIG
jgi:ABC-type sugar transport system ATPase subunit